MQHWPKARPISCNDCPAFQRPQRSVLCAKESLARLACVINTTFRENIHIRWCCIDRLSSIIMNLLFDKPFRPLKRGTRWQLLKVSALLPWAALTRIPKEGSGTVSSPDKRDFRNVGFGKSQLMGWSAAETVGSCSAQTRGPKSRFKEYLWVCWRQQRWQKVDPTLSKPDIGNGLSRPSSL
jgi:hypothetical protein